VAHYKRGIKKGKKSKRGKKDILFAPFALFALFASLSPFAMRPDFKKVFWYQRNGGVDEQLIYLMINAPICD
jgi:hypothetical protein